MPTSLNAGWEREAIHLFRLHLAVIIPLSVLVLRLLIRIFSREDYKEVLKSMGTWPLDLMVIAMSFLLTALAGFNPAFFKKFETEHDADLWAIGTIVFIFLLSIPLNRLLKWNQILAGKLYISYKQIQEIKNRSTDPPGIEIGGRILWAMGYCIFMALMLAFLSVLRYQLWYTSCI